MDGEQVAFDVDGNELVVAVDNIDKARLVPDWVALGLAPAVDKSGRDARPGKQKNRPVESRRARSPRRRIQPSRRRRSRPLRSNRK